MNVIPCDSMKTKPLGTYTGVDRLTSCFLLAALCMVWLGGASSTALAQQRLNPGAPATRTGPAQTVVAQQGLKPGAAVTRTVPANTATVQRNDRPRHDYSGIGGSVFATGLGEVMVTVHHVSEFLSDGFWAYPTTVSMVSSNKEIFLGSNRQARTTRLGKLGRGEIELVAYCPDGDGVLHSGPGDRNQDNQPRSRVREVRPGVLELYFENTIPEGTKNDREEQHWYKDVKLTFTGAVTTDSGLIVVLDKVNDPDPVLRKGARQALEMLSPTLARQVKYN